MAKQPAEPTKPTSWNIYKVAAKARPLGTAEAAGPNEAIEKGAAQSKVPASKLIATQRRRRTAKARSPAPTCTPLAAHHVALPVGKVRGLKNSEVVRGFADALPVGPRTYSLRHGDANFVVFCFAKPEDAAAFVILPAPEVTHRETADIRSICLVALPAKERER
jgi:hypothetical protein